MRNLSIRPLDKISICLSAFPLTLSLYLQYVAQLQPCLPCLVAQLLLSLSLLFSLIQLMIQSQSIKRCLRMTQFIISSLGVLMSSRQVWLAHHSNLGSCQVDLIHYIDQISFQKLLYYLFVEPSSCQKADFFLYFSLATWTLITFSLLATLALYQIWRD